MEEHELIYSALEENIDRTIFIPKGMLQQAIARNECLRFKKDSQGDNLKKLIMAYLQNNPPERVSSREYYNLVSKSLSVLDTPCLREIFLHKFTEFLSETSREILPYGWREGLANIFQENNSD